MSDDDKLDPRAFSADDLKRLGLDAWLPGDRIPHELYFGVDRDIEDAAARFFGWTTPTRPPTLRERIKGAWRGMVNGWRGGE